MAKQISKTFKKLLLGAALIFLSAIVAFSVSAETSNGVTLNITTDKTSYSANKQVTVSVSAQNDNDQSISNVSISTTLPNGFFVVDNHSTSVNQNTLEGHGSIQDSFIIGMNQTNEDDSNSGGGNSDSNEDNSTPGGSNSSNNYPSVSPGNTSTPAGAPNSVPSGNNDNNSAEDVSVEAGITEENDIIDISHINTRKFVVAFILSFAAISSILLIKRKKDIKKILSIFLVIGLTAPMLSDFSSIDVAAESGKITDSFTFTYDGQKYTISANMSYQYNEDTSDPNDREPSIYIPPYTMDPTHISEDAESEIKYIDNEIIVYFVDGYTEEMLNEVETYLNGIIVDGLPEIDKYRFRSTNVYSLLELQNVCEQLSTKYDFIEYAYWANVFTPDEVIMSDYTTDPWINDGNPIGYGKAQNEPFYWDEAFPYGSNYALELIKMPTVWNYLKNTNLSKIKIGVVDMQFSANNDLMYSYLFPYDTDTNTNNSSYHGTHVAGIIGAQNNNIGMSGILNNALMYCYDCSQLNTNENSYYIDDDIAFSRIEQAISAGCRVVNFSVGNNWLNNDGSYKEIDNKIIDKQAKVATQLISKMIQNVNRGIYEDFIIVEAAGNCKIDAYYNGYFSSITNESKLPKEAKSKNISIKDIQDRIIIVGNLSYTSFDQSFKLADMSNYGTQVNIFAPGTNILSTGFDNKMYLESGTSMAAPFVTGVCGLVWSIDKSLTASNLKKLVINSYDQRVRDSEGNIYPVLNAKEILKKVETDVPDVLDQGIVIENKLKNDYFVQIYYPNSESQVENESIYEIYDKDISNTATLNMGYDIPYEIVISKDGEIIYHNTIKLEPNVWFNINMDEFTDESFVPLYSTISGTVSDSTTGEVLTNTTVEIYTDKKYSYEDDNSGNIVVTPTVTEDYNGTLAATAISDINGNYSAKIEYNSTAVDSIYVKVNCDGYEDFSSEYLDITDNIEYDILLKTANYSGGNTDTPTESKKIKQVAIGDEHSAAITEDRSLYMWGLNSCGQLGNGTTSVWNSADSTPTKIMNNVDYVNVGYGNSAVITANGELYMWGSNFYGQLGDYNGGESSVPLKIMDEVASVSFGDRNCAAITKDGSLYTWGNNTSGQLGNGTSDYYNHSRAKIMDNVASVSLGYAHSAAITTDGSLYMWGSNSEGQLGDGTTTGSSQPIKIMDSVISVSLCNDQSAAITKDGSLYMWGRNYEGQLGDGTTTKSSTPIKILDNVVSVSLGEHHSAAITKDGSLYMWGCNSVGELGNGTSDFDAHPYPIKIMDNVASVSLGRYHSAAITKDGSLYMWGYNRDGQLGIGTYDEDPHPNPIKIEIPYETATVSYSALSTVAAVSAETSFTGLPPNEVYNIYGMKPRTVADPFSSDNMLYISQDIR